MECSTARGLLNPYEDDALQPWERQELEDHLEGCGTCRDALEDLRHTLWLLEQLEAAPAPWGFADEVMARIKAHRLPEEMPARRWVPLLGGGMLLATLLGLILLLQTDGAVAEFPTVTAQSPAQEILPLESFTIAEPGIILAELDDRWLSFLDSLIESPSMIGLGVILGACLLLAAGWMLLGHLIATGEAATHSVLRPGASDRAWGR